MTFQTEPSAAKGNSSGGIWGLKTSNQALLRTFSLMILSLIVVLAWESLGSLNPVVIPPETPNIISFNFGDAAKTKAFWASTGQLSGSGGSILEADTSRVTSEVEVDLDSIFDSVRRLEERAGRVPLELNDRATTRMGHSLLPEPSLDLSTSVHNLSETQRDPSELIQSQKPLSVGDNLVAGDGPSSEIIDMHTKEPIDLEGSRSKSEVCDFTKGHWVKDEQRPLYSGKECKAYLYGGWACREMNRKNFEYEKLRWQPEGCDLPPFTGDGFLQRLRNKVVAFVGDSLGRQQFQSLMCMITEGKKVKRVEDVQKAWGAGVTWAYRFRTTNTTILFSWSATLCDIQKGNSNDSKPGYTAMHLDRPAGFLKEFLHKLDLVILNTGHHWNRNKLESNKWHPYVDGKPLIDRKLAGMANALNFSVNSVVQWLDAELADNSSRRKHQPTVFLRTLSPRHFMNGDWDSGGTCDSPRSHYGQKTEDMVVQAKLPAYKGVITERVAENAVRGTRVNLLNITHLSLFREESHISKYGKGKDSQHQDCLHWCLPGVPDVWNELLYGNLLVDPSLSPSSQDHR